MAPDRAGSMWRSAARVQKKVPYRWTRNMRSHSSSVRLDVASVGCMGWPAMRAAMLARPRSRTASRTGAMPALLTRMSMPPCSATTPSTAAVTAAESATSKTATPPGPPNSASRSAVSLAAPSARSLTTTRAPSRASRAAIAAPNPEPAPVTSATLPRMRGSLKRVMYTRPPYAAVLCTSGDWGRDVDSGPVETTASREDRILTVPNVISLIRLLCVPLFLWLLFWAPEKPRAAAASLLGALGATDWVDGYIARHFNQVSTLGKILDPVADRILLGVAVFAIMIDGSVPLWIGGAVVLRELLVSVAVIALAAAGARRIDVQWAGKAGTFALMWAFPLLLASHATELSWHDTAGFLAWGFAIPGLILSWYAAITYIPLAKGALAEGRVGSTT